MARICLDLQSDFGYPPLPTTWPLQQHFPRRSIWNFWSLAKGALVKRSRRTEKCLCSRISEPLKRVEDWQPPQCGPWSWSTPPAGSKQPRFSGLAICAALSGGDPRLGEGSCKAYELLSSRANFFQIFVHRLLWKLGTCRRYTRCLTRWVA